MGIREELRSHVTDFLHVRVGIDSETITEDRNLYDDLGIDSLDLLAMAQGIQQKYSVSLESESIASVRTVGDLLSFAEQRIVDASHVTSEEGR